MTQRTAPESSAVTRGARRRARTREAIVDAAATVFRRDGYDAARIEQIAALADVSVGSIYTHFTGKHEVYLLVVDRALGWFADYMERSEDATMTPLQRVLAGGDAYLRFHLEHPGAFQFLAHPARESASGAETDGDTQARIRDQVGRLLDRFAAQIDAAIAAGEARAVDSKRLTQFLWGAWNGVIALRQQPEGLRITNDEVAEALEIGRWLLREAIATPALRDRDGTVGDRVPMPRIR